MGRRERRMAQSKLKSAEKAWERARLRRDIEAEAVAKAELAFWRKELKKHRRPTHQGDAAATPSVLAVDTQRHKE